MQIIFLRWQSLNYTDGCYHEERRRFNWICLVNVNKPKTLENTDNSSQGYSGKLPKSMTKSQTQLCFDDEIEKNQSGTISNY